MAVLNGKSDRGARQTIVASRSDVRPGQILPSSALGRNVRSWRFANHRLRGPEARSGLRAETQHRICLALAQQGAPVAAMRARSRVQVEDVARALTSRDPNNAAAVAWIARRRSAEQERGCSASIRAQARDWSRTQGPHRARKPATSPRTPGSRWTPPGPREARRSESPAARPSPAWKPWPSGRPG